MPSKKILVIDDDKLVVMTLRKLLTKEGYRVWVALRGAEALALVKQEEYDLIISDIKMPEMDGIETVEKIRLFRQENNQPQIPEIFITGYAQEDIYQRALALKAAAYIEKPFDMVSLLQALKDVFQ